MVMTTPEAGWKRRMKTGREEKVLYRFISVFCRAHHGTDGKVLCEQCRDLLAYALNRLHRCPYDPKPKCKACPTHCYNPEYRARIKKVMRFSGMYFIKRGRLDWLVRYFMM
jgi:hypothetical protein